VSGNIVIVIASYPASSFRISGGRDAVAF